MEVLLKRLHSTATKTTFSRIFAAMSQDVVVAIKLGASINVEAYAMPHGIESEHMSNLFIQFMFIGAIVIKLFYDPRQDVVETTFRQEHLGSQIPPNTTLFTGIRSIQDITHERVERNTLRNIKNLAKFVKVRNVSV